MFCLSKIRNIWKGYSVWVTTAKCNHYHKEQFISKALKKNMEKKNYIKIGIESENYLGGDV